MQLSLAHDAEGGAVDAVYGDVEGDPARGLGPGQFDAGELDVALLTEESPDVLGPAGDWLEPLGPDFDTGLLEPGLRHLDVLQSIIGGGEGPGLGHPCG